MNFLSQTLQIRPRLSEKPDSEEEEKNYLVLYMHFVHAR